MNALRLKTFARWEKLSTHNRLRLLFAIRLTRSDREQESRDMRMTNVPKIHIKLLGQGLRSAGLQKIYHIV